METAKRVIQLWGLFYVFLGVASLIDWTYLSSQEWTTIPEVMSSIFGDFAPFASAILSFSVGYGILTFRKWIRPLYLIVFVVITFSPPYNYTTGDIISALWDVVILYLMYLNKNTRSLFR
jgi:hypothetical protein